MAFALPRKSRGDRPAPSPGAIDRSQDLKSVLNASSYRQSQSVPSSTPHVGRRPQAFAQDVSTSLTPSTPRRALRPYGEFPEANWSASRQSASSAAAATPVRSPLAPAPMTILDDDDADRDAPTASFARDYVEAPPARNPFVPTRPSGARAASPPKPMLTQAPLSPVSSTDDPLLLNEPARPDLSMQAAQGDASLLAMVRRFEREDLGMTSTTATPRKRPLSSFRDDTPRRARPSSTWTPRRSTAPTRHRRADGVSTPSLYDRSLGVAERVARLRSPDKARHSPMPSVESTHSPVTTWAPDWEPSMSRTMALDEVPAMDVPEMEPVPETEEPERPETETPWDPAWDGDEPADTQAEVNWQEEPEAEQVEAERREAEQAEAERRETERREAERREAERREAERLEAERLEAERLEAERLEAERLEAEQAEAERLEAERLEAERLEAERLEAEQAEAERLEAERLEAERLEAERLEAEQAEAERLEAERLEAEQEAERLEAERLEAERLEAERLEADRQAQRHEAERLGAQPAETEHRPSVSPLKQGTQADTPAQTLFRPPRSWLPTSTSSTEAWLERAAPAPRLFHSAPRRRPRPSQEPMYVDFDQAMDKGPAFPPSPSPRRTKAQHDTSWFERAGPSHEASYTPRTHTSPGPSPWHPSPSKAVPMEPEPPRDAAAATEPATDPWLDAPPEAMPDAPASAELDSDDMVDGALEETLEAIEALEDELRHMASEGSLAPKAHDAPLHLDELQREATPATSAAPRAHTPTPHAVSLEGARARRTPSPTKSAKAQRVLPSPAVRRPAEAGARRAASVPPVAPEPPSGAPLVAAPAADEPSVPDLSASLSASLASRAMMLARPYPTSCIEVSSLNPAAAARAAAILKVHHRYIQEGYLGDVEPLYPPVPGDVSQTLPALLDAAEQALRPSAHPLCAQARTGVWSNEAWAALDDQFRAHLRATDTADVDADEVIVSFLEALGLEPDDLQGAWSLARLYARVPALQARYLREQEQDAAEAMRERSFQWLSQRTKRTCDVALGEGAPSAEHAPPTKRVRPASPLWTRVWGWVAGRSTPPDAPAPVVAPSRPRPRSRLPRPRRGPGLSPARSEPA
ncbi:hypothetical protein MCAP1_003092 [Malassezia caprae]|uniref:Uncharacterized protein n=1 Tax=Malassezia caprae TaxID=1381934 RepID=A0AAF0EAQ3_9BASI|nr:hypothetical protein MCAP1_003092 [Malassezia caprae]